jgi:ureidoglycolate lyase
MSVRCELPVAPLTRASFASFGEVIEAVGDSSLFVNKGTVQVFHDLATIDVDEGGGRLTVNIFRARPWPTPTRVHVMERHPLASQAFFPMSERPFLVVVAPPGPPPAPGDLRAFVTNGRQGVNYRRGVWHHPLMVLDEPADLLVLDRHGPGINLDEVSLLEYQIFLGDYPFKHGSR